MDEILEGSARHDADAGLGTLGRFRVAGIRRDVDPISRAQKDLVSRDVHQQGPRHHDSHFIERMSMIRDDGLRSQHLLDGDEALGLKNHFYLVGRREHWRLPSRHYHFTYLSLADRTETL